MKLFANNPRRFASDLNEMVAGECRPDMTVMDIDMIQWNYKETGEMRIIESKHSMEQLRTGQHLLLQKLSQMGIPCYVVRGDKPFITARVYSYQTQHTHLLSNDQLINFLNFKFDIT